MFFPIMMVVVAVVVVVVVLEEVEVEVVFVVCNMLTIANNKQILTRIPSYDHLYTSPTLNFTVGLQTYFM
jgi:hypothetical protein